MKRRMMIFAALSAAVLSLSLAFAACGSGDRPIAVEEFPQPARFFIETHFAGVGVSYALVDSELFDRAYKVVFVDGRKVEFDRDGAWTQIEARHAGLPEEAVPQPLRDYVEEHFPGRTLRGIERERRGYEVKLSGGVELEFDRNFVLTGVDD